MTEIIDDPKVDETSAIDLQQTNGQIQSKAFQYKVILPDTQVLLMTVIATSGTAAHDGLKQQFPQATFSMLGVSDHLMQINDNSVIDV